MVWEKRSPEILQLAWLPVLKHIKDNNNGVPNKGGKQIYTHTCTMHMNGCTQVHFMPAHHFIVFGCVVPVSV